MVTKPSLDQIDEKLGSEEMKRMTLGINPEMYYWEKKQNKIKKIIKIKMVGEV